MEIRGTIIQVLPLKTGVSKAGNNWSLQSYILETGGEYPKKICFEVFGDKAIQENACTIDDEVRVDVALESREYNGKWFTSVRALNIEKEILSNTIYPNANKISAPQSEDLPY